LIAALVIVSLAGIVYVRRRRYIPSPPPAIMPIAGRWDGGERTYVGMYDRKVGAFFLKHANLAEGYLTQIPFASSDPAAVPVAGDWDGDGIDTPGLYEPSRSLFRLLERNAPNSPEQRIFFFNAPYWAQAVAGDWDGDGKFEVGLYDSVNGRVYLRHSLSNGTPDVDFRMGNTDSNAQIIAGDWDGDGKWTVGLYVTNTGTFHLAAANAETAAIRSFPFGKAGSYLALSGAWSDGRVSEVGLFDSSKLEFHLDQLGEQTYDDQVVVFGPAHSNWLPLAGDWNGDGIFTIGGYVPKTSEFYLKDTNSTGRADYYFVFGDNRAWQPVAGDWDGDGKWSVGLYDPDPKTPRFYLRNSVTTGQDDLAPYCNFQQDGMKAIAGDWDGSGQTKLGHFFSHNSSFNLCTDNGNVRPTYEFAFGKQGAGWLPVVGDWNGDGKTTAGLYDPILSRFHLTDDNKMNAIEDYTFVFGKGNQGWLPLAGDWNKAGRWSIGLYDPARGEFHLRIIKPRARSDNQFQFFPAASENPNLRYFGYYNVDGFYRADGYSGQSYVDEIINLGYLNVGHLFPPLETGMTSQLFAKLNGLRNARMKAIINVQRMFVQYDTITRARPLPNWREQLAYYREQFAPYQDVILGFYFDEPIELGIDLENMQTFTKSLADAFPNQRIIVVESASQIINGNLTPEYARFVTDLGIDLYYTDPVYRTSQTQYLEGFRRLAATYDKHLWIIAEGYNRFGSTPGQLIDAFDLYYSLALTTPSVTGILVFLYPDDNKVDFPVTLRTLLDPQSKSYSPALRALHTRIGSQIIGKERSP
jgi:hypothetical protein